MWLACHQLTFSKFEPLSYLEPKPQHPPSKNGPFIELEARCALSFRISVCEFKLWKSNFPHYPPAMFSFFFVHLMIPSRFSSLFPGFDLAKFFIHVSCHYILSLFANLLTITCFEFDPA